MPAISLLSGLAFILLFTMISTSPGWIAGRITARKVPHKHFPLTMPGRGKTLTRWTFLLITGFVALSLFSVATGFNSAQNYAPTILAGIASAGTALLSQYIAFAIGHTAVTTKLTRQHFKELQAAEEDHEPAPPIQEPTAATAPLPATPAAEPLPRVDAAPIQPGIPGWT